MSSAENTSNVNDTGPKFRCKLCPYVAKSTDSLENHAKHHVLNPDAEFVCKKCPFYCSTKIELGIHSMVHAIQRRSLEPATVIPEKKIKIDTETSSVSPPQAKSRMSPFKKASSLSPNQKTLKKNLSTGQIRDKHPDSSESGSKVSPTKSIWKVKLHARSPSPPKSAESSPALKRKTFKCECCPYVTHSKKEMDTHTERHTPAPDRPFKCDLCPYYTVNNAAVVNHKRIHVTPEVESENVEVRDAVIDEDESASSAKTNSPDRKMTNKRNSIVAATCSLCPQTFTHKSNIHKHLKYHTPSPSRPHKCSHCSFCAASKGSLQIHTNLHLDQQGGDKSDQAESEYNPEEEAETLEDEEDRSDVEVEDEDETVEKMYKCDTCAYTTVHRRLIKVHIQQHTPSAERQACCPYCPYYVTVKSALTKHLRVHKEHQPVSAKKHSMSSSKITLDESQNADDEDDDKSATTENDDVSKKGGQKKKRQYICDICPYITRHWSLISTHRMQHIPSKDRQACCDYCPYYVTVKSALSKHMMVHQEYREKKETYMKIYKENTENKDVLDSSQNCEDQEDTLEEDEENEEEEDIEEDDVDEDIEDDDANDVEDDQSKEEDGQMYSCNICPYTTVHPRLMKVHREQHTPSAERQACCLYCPYYVTVRQALCRHMMIHDEHRKKKNLPPLEPKKISKRFSNAPNESQDDRESEVDESEDEESEEDEESQPEEDEYGESESEVEEEETEAKWGKVYACNICPYTTIYSRLIKTHTSKHTPSPSRQARCDYCPYYGTVKSLLAKHMVVHKEYRESKGSGADWSNMDAKAVKDEDGDEDAGDTMSNCKLCPYVPSSNHSLKRHMEFHSSSDERQVQCPYCPYFVKSQARLANHLVVHKEHVTEKNEPSLLHCSVCPYKTSSSDIMEGHTKHHVVNKDHPHACPHCPYYAKTAAQVERHAKLHPKKREIKGAKENENQSTGQAKKKTWPARHNCPTFPYQGYDPKYIARHKELHEPGEERKYKCEYCTFYVSTKNGLTHHMDLHLAANEHEERSKKVGDTKIADAKRDKYYACSICPYKTEYPFEYKKHCSHHTPRPEWPTKCRYCPFYAANFNGLSRHITIHPEYQDEKGGSRNPGNNEDPDDENEYGEEEYEDQEEEEEEEAEEEERVTKQMETSLEDVPMHHRCTICPYIGQPNKLRKHREMHTPSEKRQAKCPYCPFYVRHSASLGSHILIHTRTKADEDGVINGEDTDVTTDEEMATDDDSGNELDANDGNKVKSKSKAIKYQCTSCPYVARKPELEVHMAGHKPNPKNYYQCHYCSYACSNKTSLNSHHKVHQSGYVSNQMALYKVQLDSNQFGDCAPSSPAKSDISDVSDCDILEMANIKQQLITAKIISAPVSQNRFKSRTKDSCGDEDDDCLMEGLMVDRDGKMKLGLFKTMFRCRHCPYTNVHQDKLQQHEVMHNNKSGKYKCNYCTYKTDHKILRNRHIKVHAFQYVPGARDVNDYQCDPEEETDEGEDEEEDMEVSFKETPTEDTEVKKEADKSKAESKPEDAKLPKAAIKSPDGNSIKIKSKPVLSYSDMPPGMEYYIRQDKVTGQNYLERASVKKWCCEKCPYATMGKDRFENHAMLHASHQRNVCEFCDYSVPIYNFLLEHRKLHLQPNPNLLAMQSVTNLLSLPEVPADVAAAANFPGETDDPISRFGTHDHMELYENSDQYTEPRKLYHCDRCPYTNVRRDNLLSHLKFHMIKSELKCSYCDYSVEKHELLVQHIRVHFVDPDTIKLDMNSNPVVCKSGDVTIPECTAVLRDSANVRVTSLGKKDAKKLKEDNLAPKEGNAEEDMNNNSSSWICQYCDRAFCESDRLLRHEMQHLIGQRV